MYRQSIIDQTPYDLFENQLVNATAKWCYQAFYLPLECILLSSRCEPGQQRTFIQFITASKHNETVDVIFMDEMSLISVFILCKQFCSCVWSVTLIYYVKMVTYKEYLS